MLFNLMDCKIRGKGIKKQIIISKQNKYLKLNKKLSLDVDKTVEVREPVVCLINLNLF